MGIYCEIWLYKPTAEVYTPGSTVSGKIKYKLDKEIVLNKIIVSLKGDGWLALTNDSKKSMNSFSNSEDYVDVRNVIYENENGDPLPAGSYEADFNFQLPENIPGSLRYMKRDIKYIVRCKIKYHVCIKFQKSEFSNKQYKKKITVVSGSTPRLPTEPTVYGEQTTLFQLQSLFSSRKSIVHIKATINNSVMEPGDNVKVDYEVENSTNLTLKAVEIKLVTVDSFTVIGQQEPKIIEDVKDTLINHGAVRSGETFSASAEITIPEGLASFDHSNMIARDYAVAITVVIPTPHWNLMLQIPVQVIGRVDGYSEASGSVSSSYWQPMRVKKKEIFQNVNDSSDDDILNLFRFKG